MMELASKTTLAQMMERDDFSNRFRDNNPISLLEFFYPLYQGYDSVAVEADIEIGGNDQLWNLMLGREIQKSYEMDPQIAMTFPLLVGTDGNKKMSQSLDNYISITDTPNNIFGKIMSIPDKIMWEYFIMLTDLDISEIESFKLDVTNNSKNPFEFKKILGKLVISELFDSKTAGDAEKSFENLTINKNIPDDMPEISVEYNIEVHLPNFLTENKLSKSNSDARRLIEAGSVKIGDKKIDSIDVNSEIEFISNLNNLTLKAVGDFAEQMIKINETNNEIVNTDEQSGIYNIKYIQLFTKSTNLCGTVEIYLKTNYPLTILYNVANLGQIKYCLAPKN